MTERTSIPQCSLCGHGPHFSRECTGTVRVEGAAPRTTTCDCPQTSPPRIEIVQELLLVKWPSGKIDRDRQRVFVRSLGRALTVPDGCDGCVLVLEVQADLYTLELCPHHLNEARRAGFERYLS